MKKNQIILRVKNFKFKILSNASTIIFCLAFIFWIVAIANEQAISMTSNNPKSLENKDSSNQVQEIIGIAKISDGDTIKINDKRIRLLEIDAPETSQTCFNANYEEYACGKMSKDFLVNLINQKQVKCYSSKFDKYGRYLAKCYVGEVMINAQMVKNGMAVTYFFGDKNQEMMQFESEAKEKELGIWQGAFQMPKDYRKTHPHH